MPIASGVLHILRNAAKASHPEEACGLLFAGRDGHITAASWAANVAATPTTHFEIDPTHLLRAQRTARETGTVIAGCWHSHPNGMPIPSRTDAAGVTDARWLWLIVANDAIRAFLPSGDYFCAVELCESPHPAVAPPVVGL